MSVNRVNVRVPKTAELVARNLRERIIGNLIPEGDCLPHEAEMIAQFNVSRPTLREAFRILEAEGLITISRGTKGARVHIPTTAVVARHLKVLLQARDVELVDAYRARALVEPPAARLVAERRDPGDIAQLREIIQRQRGAIDDDAIFNTASAEFRRKLVELGGIQTLVLIVDMLNEMLGQSLVSLHASRAQEGDRIIAKRRSIKAQQKLLTLLEAGRAEEAEEFWRQHLSAVGAVITGYERIG